MPTNILQQVITYNESNLALLLNSYAFISTANKKFEKFNDQIPKNLGDTVEFDLRPRFTTANSLVVTFQPAVQRVQTLTVNNPSSTSYQFTAQQFIFNVRDYMKKFGESAVAELGSQTEAKVAQLAETNTFRFFGDGKTPISTFVQLANALARFRNFGAAKDNTKFYLPDTAVPNIINSGLNQFTPNRANKESMSWEIGSFSRCDFYESNLLKTHIAGTEGQVGSTLTVVSTTLNSNGAVIAITFSGTAAANDPNSVLAFDKFQFSDGVSGHPNLRFLTFIGGFPSQTPVQFRATATAGSTGGSQVTVSIYPPLNPTVAQGQGNEIYINNAIVAGMQVTVLPNHICGLVMSGDPLFLAMPTLPEEVPFPTAVTMDPDSGASIRTYYGSLFGQNQRGMIHDLIHGETLVDENAMMVAFPA